MAKKWYTYIFRENIYGLGIQALTFIAGVVLTVVFPNLLGKEGFGYFSIVMGIVTIMIALTDFGLSISALRFLPEGSKRGVVWKYFKVLIEWKAATSLAASILLFLGADLLAAYYRAPMLADGVRAGAALLFFYSMFPFMDNTFVAIKKARNSFILNIVYHAGRIAVPLALVVVYGLGYTGALAGTAVSCCAATALALAIAARDPQLRKGMTAALDFAPLKRYMFWGYAGGIVLVAIQWSDLLILGLFRPVSEISIYRVAWLWVTATAFLFPFSNRIFMSVHAYEDEERSRNLFNRTLKYGFVFAFLMIAGIILTAGQFIRFTYGAGFADAYPVMAILSVLTIEIALNALTNSLFTGKGDLRTPTLVMIATSALQVALVFTLAPAYGLVGVAAAVALVRLAGAIVQAVLALRFISLKIPPSYVYRPALCALAPIIVLQPLMQYSYSLPGALAYGVGVVFIYSALAVVLKAVDTKELVGIVKAAMA